MSQAPALFALTPTNAPRVGSYSVVLGSQNQSDAGVGKIIYTARGAVRLILTLADGSVISAQGTLDSAGKCTLTGKNPRHALSAELEFSDTGLCAADVDLSMPPRSGQAGSRARLVLSGWFHSTARIAIGTRAELTLQLPSGDTIAHAARLRNDNARYDFAWQILDPAADKLTLRYNPNTGMVSGNVRLPGQGIKKLLGTVLWDGGCALGFIEDGGSFELDPAYPQGGGYASGGTLQLGTPGGLTKTGSGTLTLSGSNTYTGPITVSGCSLILSGGTLTPTP